MFVSILLPKCDSADRHRRGGVGCAVCAVGCRLTLSHFTLSTPTRTTPHTHHFHNSTLAWMAARLAGLLLPWAKLLYKVLSEVVIVRAGIYGSIWAGKEARRVGAAPVFGAQQQLYWVRGRLEYAGCEAHGDRPRCGFYARYLSCNKRLRHLSLKKGTRCHWSPTTP